MVKGLLDKKVICQSCLAVVQPLKSSVLPADVEVAPYLYRYDVTDDTVTVKLSNMTSSTISVSPKSVIGQLQLCEEYPQGSVKSQQIVSSVQDNSPYLDKIDFSSSAISGSQLMDVKSFLSQFPDIFSHQDTDIGFTSIWRL